MPKPALLAVLIFFAVPALTGADEKPPPTLFVMGAYGMFMNEDMQLTGERAPLHAVWIKHKDSAKEYRIDTLRVFWDMIEVKPGTYCLSKARFYSNQTVKLCDEREAFEVLPGMINYYGVWEFSFVFTREGKIRYRWRQEPQYLMYGLEKAREQKAEEFGKYELNIIGLDGLLSD